MLGTLPELAGSLGINERTLRRAIERGMVHAHRPSPRRIRFAPSEIRYLESHWGTLSELTAALRSEPSVSLAVLYGSAARGESRKGSDLDLLVLLRPQSSGLSHLELRLSEAVGKPVEVAHLESVRESAPLLLEQVLNEGRVLVDRDDAWSELNGDRDRIAAAARRAIAAEERAAAEAYEELVG